MHVHLKALEEKGLIKRDPLKSRSIALTYQLEDAALATNVVQPSFSNIVNVPLVGNVAAGSPILAEENITDTLSLPTEIVGDAPSFLLSVRGESMIEAGINDGDYVVVKEQPVANNGDIVVAIIDDGATVKRFFKESDHIRLQPENSTMDPIITTDCGHRRQGGRGLPPPVAANRTLVVSLIEPRSPAAIRPLRQGFSGFSERAAAPVPAFAVR